MLVIESVKPDAREMRPLQRGWGWLHWVVCLPQYGPILSTIVFGLTVSVIAGDHLPPVLLGSFIIGVWMLWVFSSRLSGAVATAEGAKAPVGRLDWRWTIDDQGLAFENGLQSNRVDWRGVKSVRADRDRFVFLVAPHYNPVLPTRLLTAAQTAELEALIAEVTASGHLGRGVD
ncbi:MAG: YcxB family protein [Brevundimonas sp.]|nr:MAG: YcxB family protein [Brevundimonas sp.]